MRTPVRRPTRGSYQSDYLVVSPAPGCVCSGFCLLCNLGKSTPNKWIVGVSSNLVKQIYFDSSLRGVDTSILGLPTGSDNPRDRLPHQVSLTGLSKIVGAFQSPEKR
jgi:hypothetical protein